MSFYNDASLIFLPNAGKDTKAYSAKPTDGSGDFTFSRGSNLTATRVGPTGLIEKGRENLLLQSNQFDTTWTTSSASVTSGQSGYDGSSDAWLLTATNTFNRVQQSISVSGVKRFSVYAKANTNDYLLLGSVEGGHYYATFNLATGAVDSNNINAISPSIESVGNGWYRCSATWVSTTTQVRIGTQDSSGQGAWATTTSGSIYIQDAQLEAGLVATDYIETGATTAQAGILEDMPRLDYSGGTCPALLLEPQRTNLLAYSEYLEGSGWNKSNAGTGSLPVISTNTNDTTSPEGEYNATKIVFDAGSGTTTGDLSLLEGVVTIAASTEASTSIWLKGENGGEQLHMRGVANSAFQIITLTTEWQKFTTTENSSTTTDSLQFGIRQNVSGLGIINSSATIYAYGAQIEEGSYPTSYIPTYGTSVTRGADDCSVTGVSSLIGQTEGTIYVEFEFSKDIDAPYRISLSDGTTNNRIQLGTYGNEVQVYVQTSGVTQVYTLSGTISVGTHKMALAYATNDYVAYLDGSAVITDTSASVPACSKLEYRIPDGTGLFEHPIKQQVLFPTRLTNTELAALTTI